MSTVLEPDDYFKVVEAGTCPLITMEIPQMKQLITEKKASEEQVGSHDKMRNTHIEEIIIEQNLPTPLESWKDSKVLLLTRYLAAVVHYFIYSQADQAHPMMNKLVAEKFSLSSSNLHRIITGRR